MRILSLYLIYLAGILDILLGVFVLLKNMRSAKNFSFFLFSLFIGLWSLAVANYLLATSLAAAYFWMHVITLFLIAIPAALYHVFCAFSFENIRPKLKYICLLYLSILFVIPGYFFPGFFIKDILFRDWLKIAVQGPGYYLLSFLYGLIVFIVFYQFYKSFSENSSDKEIRIKKFLFYSLLVAICFGSVFNWLLPFLNYYKLIWVGPYSLFIVIATASYAIVRHRLMDIEVVVKKTIVYSVLTIFITGLLFFSILLSERYFRHVIGEGSVFTLVVFAFILALIFKPLQERIQTTVDALFFKSKYDYRDILRVLSARTVAIIEIDKLFKIVLNTVRTTLSVDNASIYLLDEHKDLFKKH